MCSISFVSTTVVVTSSIRSKIVEMMTKNFVGLAMLFGHDDSILTALFSSRYFNSSYNFLATLVNLSSKLQGWCYCIKLMYMPSCILP